jgi:hypothetical protein
MTGVPVPAAAVAASARPPVRHMPTTPTPGPPEQPWAWAHRARTQSAWYMATLVLDQGPGSRTSRPGRAAAGGGWATSHRSWLARAFTWARMAGSRMYPEWPRTLGSGSPGT